MSQPAGAARLPFLSVVIPTRNRPRQMRQCLESLVEQAYPSDRWELIVILDGEDCPALDESEWSNRLVLRVIRQPHGGCGTARNTGVASASGEYVVFTDDDCVFPPDWLLRYAQCIQRYSGCLLAGRSINGLPENPYTQTTQDIIDYLIARGNSVREDAAVAIGNNFAVPAAAFRESSGFSDRYFRTTAEDRDFCERWRESGKRVVFAPEVTVEHLHALTLRSFAQQHFRYGFGAWLLHRRPSDRAAAGPQSVAFYLGLLGWPFRVYDGLRAWKSFALFLLAQTAHTAGYLYASFARSPVQPTRPGIETLCNLTAPYSALPPHRGVLLAVLRIFLRSH